MGRVDWGLVSGQYEISEGKGMGSDKEGRVDFAKGDNANKL